MLQNFATLTMQFLSTLVTAPGDTPSICRPLRLAARGSDPSCPQREDGLPINVVIDLAVINAAGLGVLLELENWVTSRERSGRELRAVMRINWSY